MSNQISGSDSKQGQFNTLTDNIWDYLSTKYSAIALQIMFADSSNDYLWNSIGDTSRFQLKSPLEMWNKRSGLINGGNDPVCLAVVHRYENFATIFYGSAGKGNGWLIWEFVSNEWMMGATDRSTLSNWGA